MDVKIIKTAIPTVNNRGLNNMTQLKINEKTGAYNPAAEIKVEAPTLDGVFLILAEKGILDLNRIGNLLNKQKSKGTSI